MKVKLIIIPLVIFVLAVAIFFYNKLHTSTTPPSSSTEFFSPSKKSAHHVSNAPVNGAIVAAPPVHVVIDFDSSLNPSSSIHIINLQDGLDYGVGQTIISNQKSILRGMNQTAPDQTYTVKYNACSEKKCEEGSFQFLINRNQISNYTDFKNNFEAKVYIRNNVFDPSNIRVKRGEKIVWINSTDSIQTIRSDPPQTYSYYRELQSPPLKKNDAYTIVLHTPGEYFYHSQTNSNSFQGSIVVE